MTQFFGTHEQMPTHSRQGTNNRPKNGSTKIQFSEPMSFTGSTYRNMGEGLLKGAEITQEQLYHQKLTIAW